jgi:hypothetical protein
MTTQICSIVIMIICLVMRKIFPFAAVFFDLTWDRYRYIHNYTAHHSDEDRKWKIKRSATYFGLLTPLFSSHSSQASHSRYSFLHFFHCLPSTALCSYSIHIFAVHLYRSSRSSGWIDLFAELLVKATGRKMIPTIWVIGILEVVLCNAAGTSIGAAILLTKVVHAAQIPHGLQ